ncbi:MAG TPA: threonine/serine dehydratase [Vicinamibacterales bacterium]|nr:threonine/serine dehydratase [Vicinamibacterales bacterium]
MPSVIPNPGLERVADEPLHNKATPTHEATQSRANMITRDEIRATWRLIQPHIRKTPIVETTGSDFGLAVERVLFKLELCQYAGSFKTRGAFNNLLSRDVPPAGVVAASGGNHGLAVAFAAHKLGVPARIYVPTVSASVKIAKMREYGADLVVDGDRYADALAASKEWAAESGALEIHAYDQIETLLGQGTLALELEEQAPNLDTILIAVGGGGLIGGVAACFAERVANKTMRIVGVEPETAPTLTYAFRAGHPVDSPAGGVAVDSLAPLRVGELMFGIAQEYVSDVVLVTDDAIRRAQLVLWDQLRVAAEPGGAAAFSALLSGAYQPLPSERVGVVVCGGNTTAVSFER